MPPLRLRISLLSVSYLIPFNCRIWISLFSLKFSFLSVSELKEVGAELRECIEVLKMVIKRGGVWKIEHGGKCCRIERNVIVFLVV